MHTIYDGDGKVICRSQDMRGIRSYVGRKAKPVEVCIRPIGEEEGQLKILFQGGDNYTTDFACWAILKKTIKNWRKLYGTKLIVSGIERDKVSFQNLYLQ